MNPTGSLCANNCARSSSLVPPGIGLHTNFSSDPLPFYGLSIETPFKEYNQPSQTQSVLPDGQVHCEKLRNLVIQRITEARGRIDYAEIVDEKSLKKVEFIRSPVVFYVAAWFGKVRLIDNMEINL